VPPEPDVWVAADPIEKTTASAARRYFHDAVTRPRHSRSLENEPSEVRPRIIPNGSLRTGSAAYQGEAEPAGLSVGNLGSRCRSSACLRHVGYAVADLVLGAVQPASRPIRACAERGAEMPSAFNIS
jgi:hypothetical protein